MPRYGGSFPSPAVGGSHEVSGGPLRGKARLRNDLHGQPIDTNSYLITFQYMQLLSHIIHLTSLNGS